MKDTDQANADSMTASAPPTAERPDAVVLDRTGDPTTYLATTADGVVYLEHLDQPMAHARHYLGWTPYSTPALRHQQHLLGRGARLLQVANERGITYGIVRVWLGGRSLERRLKAQHHGPRLCPICNRRKVEPESDLGKVSVRTK
jgi:hypothetical protein